MTSGAVSTTDRGQLSAHRFLNTRISQRIALKKEENAEDSGCDAQQDSEHEELCEIAPSSR